MFAIIGQKINDRLKGNADFVNANGKTLGSELISNNTWDNTTGWLKYPPAAPIVLSVVNNTLKTDNKCKSFPCNNTTRNNLPCNNLRDCKCI